MTVYVVEALRWGDRENHSYVVGVYHAEIDAQKAADLEDLNRGGKYVCDISKIEMDFYKGEWLE